MRSGISARAFAKLDGCSSTLVLRGIKEGRLKPLPDGSLDPALARSGWRAGNRQDAAGSAGARPGAQQGDADADLDDAERLIASEGLLSLVDAERLKENYLARLRQLEYDQKAGAVVPVEAIAKRVGDAFARVRTRLLAIPPERAPRLHRCKTLPEMQDALTEAIVEALQELTADEEAGPR